MMVKFMFIVAMLAGIPLYDLDPLLSESLRTSSEDVEPIAAELSLSSTILNRTVQPAGISISESTMNQNEIEPAEFSLNGVTLTDSKKTVVDKLGIPLHIKRDRFIVGTEEYVYSGMTVGFVEGYVQYVRVSGGSKFAIINGHNEELQVERLQKIFGKPDYIAEDGIVFQRGSSYLKAYLSTKGSNQVKEISMFNSSSM